MSANAAATDLELIADYSSRHVEDAFAELVRRHIDLVYSAALRQVQSPQLAEEVTQTVFADLARAAVELKPDTVLAAWLYRVTRHAAIDVVRRETRRLAREQVATESSALNITEASWAHLEPLLDEAVAALEDTDQSAVLLRYFENKSLREIGRQLGVSDDAAQKRVSRAVEQLREFFGKRGIPVSASGLTVVLAANAVQAAPAGLALTVATAAVSGTTIAATALVSKTAATTFSWLNFKSAAAVIVAACAAGTGTYYFQQQTADQLRSENQKLLVAQQALTQERDEAQGAAARNAEELQRRESDKAELMRLRGEVGPLRRTAKEVEQLREENRQYQEALRKLAANPAPPESEPEPDSEKRFAIERLNQSKQLLLGMIMYAGDNNDLLPTDLNSISNYLGNAAMELLATNSFDLVLQGSITNVSNPSATIALRSRTPFIMHGKPAKVYGFADGHAELQHEPAEGFDAWEKPRLQVPAER